MTDEIAAPEAPEATKQFVVLSAASPRFEKDGAITLMVLFENLKDLGALPFTASPEDATEHGRLIFEEAQKGSYGEIAAYERPLPTVEDLQAELDKLMPDIMLGLATDEEVSLAKSLRIQIKAMS